MLHCCTAVQTNILQCGLHISYPSKFPFSYIDFNRTTTNQIMTLHYLYKKRINQHGFNDGYEETDELDLLLNVSGDREKILAYQERYELHYYRRLEQSILLVHEERQSVLDFFGGIESGQLTRSLGTMDFDKYKKLRELIK